MSENVVIWKNYDATGRDFHVDVPLSSAIQNYRTQGLLGEDIFPVVPVTKQSNMIPVIPLGDFLRSEAAYRAPGTEANKVKFNINTLGYFCKNYALKYPLTIEDRENADEVWNVRQRGAELISDLIRIGKELRVFSTINSSTNVNTVFVPKSAWNAGGNPLDAVLSICRQVQDTTGFYPNKLYFGKAAWRATITNSVLRNLLFPHGGGLVSTTQFAQLSGVENVQVANGYYNTAAEGRTATLASFFDDAVFACFNPAGNQIGPLPRYSATMRWSIPGVPSMVVQALPYDAKIKAEEIEVGVYDDEKVIDKTLGVIIKGVNSAQANGV